MINRLVTFSKYLELSKLIKCNTCLVLTLEYTLRCLDEALKNNNNNINNKNDKNKNINNNSCNNNNNNDNGRERSITYP